jgi:hypothetical protein
MAFCKHCEAAGEVAPNRHTFMKMCHLNLQGVKFYKHNGYVTFELQQNVVQLKPKREPGNGYGLSCAV